jgi:hypothetical protein
MRLDFVDLRAGLRPCGSHRFQGAGRKPVSVLATRGSVGRPRQDVVDQLGKLVEESREPFALMIFHVTRPRGVGAGRASMLRASAVVNAPGVGRETWLRIELAQARQGRVLKLGRQQRLSVDVGLSRLDRGQAAVSARARGWPRQSRRDPPGRWLRRPRLSTGIDLRGRRRWPQPVDCPWLFGT